MISTNFGPSRDRRIFDVPSALAGLDRFEHDVVAGSEKTERRRRWRREAVGQERQELEQILAPRAAKTGRQVWNRELGEVRGQPVEGRVAEPAQETRLRCRGSRAPTTRSYSPRRDARRTASDGLVLAVAVDDEHVTRRWRRGCRS